MAAKQLMLPANRAFSSDGLPEAGALVRLYESGTTTPANFYADAGLTISLGSTLIANAAGRLAQIAYQDENTAFRLKVFDANGDELDDLDPYYFGTIYGATILGSGLTIANTRADLDDVATGLGTVYLMEAGREGQFVFDSSDLSAMVTLDSQQGIYVPPATAPTGASGAWVRQYNGPANVSWFGAALDNVTDDRDALQVALNVSGSVEVPIGKTLVLGTGDVQMPSNSVLHISGEIRYTGATQYMFRVLGNKSNITVTGPGTISSALDEEFLQVFRLESALGEVTDGFRVTGGIKMNYTDTVHTGGDRWMIVCSGQGTRQNIVIEDVVLTGRMQLTAAMASNGFLKNCEIRNNRVHNAGANPISISCTGAIASGNTGSAENVRIYENTITSDSSGHSAVGIFIGVDGSSNDQVGILKNIEVFNNFVDISLSPDKLTDLLIRLGNDASNMANGYLSTADNIQVYGNTFNYGVDIDQPAITSANALTKATNFTMRGNKFLGGDIILANLADGANVQGNESIRVAGSAVVRMGQNNGKLNFVANKWTTFNPQSGDAEFEITASNDAYEGSPSAASDQPVKLNVNAGKVQTLYLDNCTINSQSTGGTRGPVKTSGAGTANVHIRNLASHTTWALSGAAYEHTATSGGITDYTQKPVTYTPTLTAVNNCSGLSVSKAVYERRESYVRVSALLAGTATAGATSTRFNISLPVASNLTLQSDVIGVCQSISNVNDDSGYVQADPTNDVAQLGFLPTPSGAFTVNVVFHYQVK